MPVRPAYRTYLLLGRGENYMKKMFLGMTLLFACAVLTSAYASNSYTCYAKFGENHPLLSGSITVSADSNDEAIQKTYKWYKDNYPDVSILSVRCE